jgi:1-acyl-sn-glycerol-3-phosphate acyltransferase
MKFIFGSIRFFILFIVALLSTLIVITVKPCVPHRIWAKVVKQWSLSMLKATGVVLKINANVPYLMNNVLIVANHISWLDIPVLYAICFVKFIARSEMRKWWLLRVMIDSTATIFINRSRKKDLLHINQTIARELPHSTVALFPEGKTSSGESVLPFKSSLFESAMISDARILPIVLNYYHKSDHKFASEVTYAGKLNFLQAIKNSIWLNGIIVKITVLPDVLANSFSNRDELAKYLHHEIFRVYNDAKQQFN